MAELSAKRRWLLALLLLLLVVTAYGGYRAFRGDPAVEKVKQLQKELRSPESANLTPEQRRDKSQAMRDAMKDLSPAQRELLAAEGRKKFQAEMQRYGKMSKEEKTRYLDEQIDRSEAARKARAAAGGNTGRPGGGNGAAGQGRPQQGGAAQGGQPTSGGTANGQGNGGNRTPEEREQRRKQFLDSTTPEFRASFDQYRKDMEARRKQRGMQPSPWGR